MIVKVRVDKNKSWGFLEKYEYYCYEGKGYVKALVGVTTDKKLSPVFAYKGEEFVSLEEIDVNVGIDRYLKAKKPLYSKLGDCFLVVLKAQVDFVNKVYFPEKSSFELYTINGKPTDIKGGIPFKKVLDTPPEFKGIVEEPLRLLGESFGNREKFLRSRLYGKDNS